jgi:hypothetical protein
MDVALDANVILNDPRMKGNAFHSLLDYLKKTDSRLVLTRIVLDEVIARYPERLRGAVHKATTAVGALGSLAFDPKIMLPQINIERETQKLKEKLRKPSRYVNSSRIVNNFSDVKIEEVIKRGIERVPPASGRGEELRDVIHWLMMLAYVRASKRELAFVTGDEHFRREAALHPRLEKDIQDNNVSLRFYVSVDEFIKAHAPAPHDLTEAEAFALHGKSEVMNRFEVEARRFFPSRWRNASSVQVLGRDVRLMRGALYDVGSKSKFGELEFSGDIRTRVTTEMPSVSSVFTNYSQPTNPPVMPGVGTTYYVPGNLGIPFDFPSLGPEILNSESLRGIGATVSGYDFGSSNAGFGIVSMLNSPASAVESVSEFRVTGSIVISLRVVSGRVVNIETERFELETIEKAD